MLALLQSADRIPPMRPAHSPTCRATPLVCALRQLGGRERDRQPHERDDLRSERGDLAAGYGRHALPLCAAVRHRASGADHSPVHGTRAASRLRPASAVQRCTAPASSTVCRTAASPYDTVFAFAHSCPRGCATDAAVERNSHPSESDTKSSAFPDCKTGVGIIILK